LYGGSREHSGLKQLLKSFSRLAPVSSAAEFFISIGRMEVKSMPAVVLRPNESQDGLLKRFRKKVVKSGVLSTVRRKRWFISKSEMRRVEAKKSMRRVKRRQMGKLGE